MTSGGVPSERRREPPFDPTSWSGALIVMGVVTAGLFAIQIVNAGRHYSLNRFGLRPREIDGLWGVLTQPFLHHSYGHLLSNAVPLIGIGWVLLLSGLRTWLTVSAIVVVVGGVAAWLVAPSGVVVGASAMIFGWLGYLLARAYFSRQLKWIFVAVMVLLFFGTLLTSLLPSFDSHVSWESHACGFAAGILAGGVLHQRPHRPGRGRTMPARRTTG
ncbi:MAG TPA: rhomboid family intramembrane serine protease [Jatrophihabitantaceae bacterium]|jgi:membrane associated rhomboid family serine protease|nr:rhomboid family intramembrane serine protease [Jatrophihabitantaceae bacterium]